MSEMTLTDNQRRYFWSLMKESGVEAAVRWAQGIFSVQHNNAIVFSWVTFFRELANALHGDVGPIQPTDPQP